MGAAVVVHMTRRSVLFSPGDQPSLMRKAPTTGADVVVFDLEDAVAPARKGDARRAVSDLLTAADFDPDCEVCVRVNPVGSGAGDDVDAVLSGGGFDSVVVPKVTDADDVATVDSLLAEHDATSPVLALVESAAGVLNAHEIAAAGPTDALVFGAEDLSADIGATRTDEGTEVLYARERVVLAASAADVDAIDTVHTAIEDPSAVAADARFAADLGFDGKLAIHPAQVDPINDAYTPTEADTAWATRVLDAAADSDAGVFRVDGEMIDAPLIAQAERIMRRARAADN